MLATEAIMQSTLGIKARYMRPPFGEVNDVALNVLKALDYKVIIWNLDTNDWQYHNSAPINILNTYRNGVTAAGKGTSSFIVLEHDTYLGTVDSVDAIITDVVGKGYSFVTVADCLGDTMSPYK